jgi:hypothetical protein
VDPPYEKGFVGETPECDVAIHPTGQLDDWSCGYSDCEDGGDESVICGCVDLDAFGIGSGQKWFCIHSTCQCEAEDTATSASTRVLVGSALGVTAMLAWASF